jgi:hypothetical protein
MQGKTIIVGAGMAGLACAQEFSEAGHDFLLISKSLGGRVLYDPAEKINYGAYFVMQNYHYARRFVVPTTLINPLHACFHKSAQEYFSVISGHTLKLLPEFLRFFVAMQEFKRHYEPYKERCLRMTQRAALEADPYMAELFQKPARQFIQEKHYERVAADYIGKFSYACTGVSMDQITALDFLNVSMGILVPIHQFRFDEVATRARLGSHFIEDEIVAIDSQPEAISLKGASGNTYLAENIVVATPASVTQKLLGLAEIREACQLYVTHVKAQLKGSLSRYELNLFPPTSEIILTALQWDGSYLIYSRTKEADLNQVCDSFSVLRTVDWEKAMYVMGRAYMEQRLNDRMYIAGDHNGLGLEPTAISGMYAARQILAKN